jgi:sec-independent protein translocase protein TatC
MFWTAKPKEYPDDIFAETRMSFGDHIEELRKHLLLAIYGLLVTLVGGFALDGIGSYLQNSNIGMGRPMLNIIVEPVESQVRAFYARRNEQAQKKLLAENPEAGRLEQIKQKLRDKDMDLNGLTSEERKLLLGAPEVMPVMMPIEPLVKLFGPPKDPEVTEIRIELKVYPTYVNYIQNLGENRLENKQYLTTLSVQEAFVVYFKVSLLCGFVVASPWIFFQMWAFIAAGLYPHERAYVYRFLGPSVALFLAGVFLCQFVVLPGAVKALVAFNNWIELDPDLRLNEWLGFALVLPVVFGISFQTPLVMFFFNRIGMFGWEDYWARWRHATLGIAFFSAIITPTPDAVTMTYLFVPMFGLYLLGVGVCKWFPPQHEIDDEEEDQVAV